MRDRPAPLYLLAGGGRPLSRSGADPLLRAVLGRIGGERPKVAYVGVASGDNSVFQFRIGKMLEQAGAGNVTLAPLCGSRADPGQAKAVLAGSEIVFISGGDVDEGMRTLQDQGMVQFLRQLYRRGKPFLGISAGSILLAERWVRWTRPDEDDSAELFSCLGCARILCDTHGEGEDWVELQAALAISPLGTIGHGIVSGAALVVEGDGSLSVLGGEVAVFSKDRSGVRRLSDLRATERVAPVGFRGMV